MADFCQIEQEPYIAQYNNRFEPVLITIRYAEILGRAGTLYSMTHFVDFADLIDHMMHDLPARDLSPSDYGLYLEKKGLPVAHAAVPRVCHAILASWRLACVVPSPVDAQ